MLAELILQLSTNNDYFLFCLETGAVSESYQSTSYSPSATRQASGCPICSQNLTFTHKVTKILLDNYELASGVCGCYM